MKLLLTSAGITNQSLVKTLFEMVGKKPEETSLVFIPTAANLETGDKEWLIEDLTNLKNLGLKSITIADISAVTKEVWLPQFEEADILFFEGGNTYYLMEWMNKSGLTEILPELLKTKVYVGVSAGSMVTNPDLDLKISQIIYGEDLDKTESIKGLNYVDFYFLPHLNSPYFENVREELIRNAVEGVSTKVYAVDDAGAVQIVDGNVGIVTEGKYLEIN